jgi:hypothetical protein
MTVLASNIEHVASMNMNHVAESRCASEASFSTVFGGATFSTGPKRATPAQRSRQLLNLLLDLLRTEWDTIKTFNLGKEGDRDMCRLQSR